MSAETESLKKDVMNMAVSDLELLFKVIGDLTFTGYKISLCRLRGYSYQQCATKFGISKREAQKYYERCLNMGHDEFLKKTFNLK